MEKGGRNMKNKLIYINDLSKEEIYKLLKRQTS